MNYEVTVTETELYLELFDQLLCWVTGFFLAAAGLVHS